MYKKVYEQIIIILFIAAYLLVSSSEVQVSHAQPNQDMKAVLDLHNRERVAVGFPPLMWSDSLAAASQSWANHLATLGIVCGPQGCKPTPTHGANNENIAFGLSGHTPGEYAQLWADEKVKYDAGQHSGPGIGHYTAMVWKSTREVGCGFVAGHVGGTDFLVCRYNPPGNVGSQASSNLPNYSATK